MRFNSFNFMRLDHIAYRVADRNKTVKFFIDALGYQIQTEFDIDFQDGSQAKCFALQPPKILEKSAWTCNFNNIEYHLPPEIFVSDGTPDSIVGKWVAERNNIGGIHHLAYQVESVEKIMQEWKEKGYAEFTTDKPLTCPGLTQVFTKPSELTGVIYEFIERNEYGFCKENVKDLMNSTKNL